MPSGTIQGQYRYIDTIAQVMNDDDGETMLDMISIALSDNATFNMLINEVGLEKEDFDRLYRKVEACLAMGQNRPAIIGNADENTNKVVWIWCPECQHDVYRGDSYPEDGSLHTCDKCGRVYMTGKGLFVRDGTFGEVDEAWKGYMTAFKQKE